MSPYGGTCSTVQNYTLIPDFIPFAQKDFHQSLAKLSKRLTTNILLYSLLYSNFVL